jgi:hypothetical protein
MRPPRLDVSRGPRGRHQGAPTRGVEQGPQSRVQRLVCQVVLPAQSTADKQTRKRCTASVLRQVGFTDGILKHVCVARVAPMGAWCAPVLPVPLRVRLHHPVDVHHLCRCRGNVGVQACCHCRQDGAAQGGCISHPAHTVGRKRGANSSTERIGHEAEVCAVANQVT